MPNESIKQHALPIRAKLKSPRTSAEVKARSTLADFLIETGFWPLVLIGKGVKSFGWAAVLAFIVGAGGLWGYAAVTKTVPLVELKAPPPITLPAPSPQIKMVRLSGIARERGQDGNLHPITEPFSVAVMANQKGQPGLDPEGTFFLDVPANNNYDVLLWKTKDDINFFDNMPAVQDNDGLKLQWPLRYKETPPSTEVSAVRHPATKSKIELAQAFTGQ